MWDVSESDVANKVFWKEGNERCDSYLCYLQV